MKRVNKRCDMKIIFKVLRGICRFLILALTQDPYAEVRRIGLLGMLEERRQNPAAFAHEGC